MRQQDTELVMREWVLEGPEGLVPVFVGWWRHVRRRYELVPGIRRAAAACADGARQHVQQPQAAGDLPAAEVAGRRVTPDVAGELVASAANLLGHLQDALSRNAGFDLGKLGCVLGVALLQQRQEGIEGALAL